MISPAFPCSPPPATALNGFVAVQLIGFPAGACVFLLNTQAKWQFSAPCVPLTGLRRPHLAVLALILIAFVVVLPLVASLLGGNLLVVMASQVTLAAPFLWASHANWPFANMAAIALFFSLYNNSVAAFWLNPDSAARWLPIHLALLAVGWTAVVAWLWRLTRLREDLADYGLPLDSLIGFAMRTRYAPRRRWVPPCSSSCAARPRSGFATGGIIASPGFALCSNVHAADCFATASAPRPSWRRPYGWA